MEISLATEITWAIILGYLIGSIPTGLIFSKLFTGKDLRQFGSGKSGFTNSIRVLGVKRALPVFAIDLTKGLAATALPLLFSDNPWAQTCGGLAAIVGHILPIFADFKGGRGILTGTGVLLVLNPIGVVIGLVIAGPVLIIWRYVSLASIIGCVAIIVSSIAFLLMEVKPTAVEIGLMLGATLIIYAHRDNISRLHAGTESKMVRPRAVN